MGRITDDYTPRTKEEYKRVQRQIKRLQLLGEVCCWVSLLCYFVWLIVAFQKPVG